MAGWVVSMEKRLAIAVARHVDKGVSVSALAAELGVSRTTFYVYLHRFEEEGLPGLVPRSRAPKSHPNRVSRESEAAVLAMRTWLKAEGWDHGARSVWAWMRRAGQDPPSERTIHRIFVRHGLIAPQPQKRPRAKTRRFQAARPNGCWQLDGMPWWLADGTEVKIIRVLDDCSRKGLGRRVADTESGPEAWACLSAAIDRHGPPAMLLSDNSLAFNGSRRHVEVDMQRRLRELGIAQVAASVHHPQTCGKSEREHQTMQRWLRAHPPTATKADLEALLDHYEEVYNQQRPHQGLGGLDTPEERYAATAKAVPANRPIPAPVLGHDVKVTRTGEVPAHGASIHIGREWADTDVHVIRQGNHVAVFHHGHLLHATAIDPTRRYQPSGRKPGRPTGGQPLPRITPVTAQTATGEGRSQDGAPAAKRGRTILTPTNPRRQSKTGGTPSTMS
jgi:transposase InsO family protein